MDGQIMTGKEIGDFPALNRVGEKWSCQVLTPKNRGKDAYLKRVAATPDWAKTELGIQKLLLKQFPKLDTNDHQRERAGTWLRVIELYHRAHLPVAEIAGDMKMSPGAVKQLLRRIDRAARGIRISKPKPDGDTGRLVERTISNTFILWLRTQENLDFIGDFADSFVNQFLPYPN